MMRLPQTAGIAVLAALMVWGCTEQAPPATLPAGPGIQGILAAEDGVPLPYVQVMACTRTVCFYSDTDSGGRFTFLLEEPGDFLIKTTEDLAARPRRTSPMVPVTVVGDELLDAGTVYAPTLPEDAPVDASGVAEAGDGLTLVFGAGSGAPAALAARRIPDRMMPRFPASFGGEVVAVYALHPFGWKSDTPVGIRIAGLPARHAALRIHTIDDLDGRLSDPVAGRWEDGTLVTGPGEGIMELTHLAVVAD